MSTERNELRRDIERSINWASIDSLANTPDFELADKIIESPYLAGYRKPRTITTREELDELRDGAVVVDSSGDVAELRGGEWCSYETAPMTFGRMAKYLPATLIHVGDVK